MKSAIMKPQEISDEIDKSQAHRVGAKPNWRAGVAAHAISGRQTSARYYRRIIINDRRHRRAPVVIAMLDVILVT